MYPEFEFEGRERRFRAGQVIDLPDVLRATDGTLWHPDWLEVSTLDDRAIGERVFIPGLCELIVNPG